MNQNFVKIYKRGLSIEAIPLSSDLSAGKKLESQGYIYVKVIEVCAFLVFIHNSCTIDNVFDSIEGLRKDN